MNRKALRMLGLTLLGLPSMLAACAGPATAKAQHPRITFSSTSGAVGVPSSNYQVVVATSGPCFVQAIPGGPDEVVFSGMVPPGQTQTFTAVSGKLSVILGSVQVKVTVQVDGRIVPGWQYTPTSTPFTLKFASVA